MKKIVILKNKWLFTTLCFVVISFFLQIFPNSISMETSAMGLEHANAPKTIFEQGEQAEADNNIIEEDYMPAKPLTPLDSPAAKEQNTVDKIAYITFDDGPSATTERLLDILAEYNVKATFFMLQPQMLKYPHSVLRLAEEGHALALHGVTHRQELFYQSAESVLNEMATAQNTLLELTGCRATLIRVPYGSYPHMKPEYVEAVKQAGYQMWDWNVDSRDWYYRDQRMVSETIGQIERLEQQNIAPVILLHDRAETAEYVAEILEYLLSNGYRLNQLDDTMEPVVF